MIEHLIELYSIEFVERECPSHSVDPVPSTSKSTLLSSLLSKHIQNDNNTSTTLEDEMNRFQDMGKTDDDVLVFWQKNETKYPKLAAVARVALAIPMTTAKAEGSFSTAGCVLRKQRSSITPLRAEKALFIHDNYHLLRMK